jgi:hypothetical protein
LQKNATFGNCSLSNVANTTYFNQKPIAVMTEFYSLLIVAVVFFAIYHIFKTIFIYSLKRKIIKNGHFEKAEIIEQKELARENYDRSPSLKWGLVALFAGLGIVLFEVLHVINPELFNYRTPFPFGVYLIFIALGFLIYYFYMVKRSK